MQPTESFESQFFNDNHSGMSNNHPFKKVVAASPESPSNARTNTINNNMRGFGSSDEDDNTH